MAFKAALRPDLTKKAMPNSFVLMLIFAVPRVLSLVLASWWYTKDQQRADRAFALIEDWDLGIVYAGVYAALLVHVFNFWYTGTFRRAAGVMYPNHAVFRTEAGEVVQTDQAPGAASAYNRAARACANYQEWALFYVPVLMLAGFVFPTLAKVSIVLWAGGRTVYIVGYTSGPTNGLARMPGFAVSTALGMTIVAEGVVLLTALKTMAPQVLDALPLF